MSGGLSERWRIGCAGWAIPKAYAALFPFPGGHLERYAQRFTAAEINSSFYRPHRRSTYERWAVAVPDDFAFSVKAPKEITHRRRLGNAEETLDAFLAQAAGLGAKLGPLLFQLPPSFAFDSRVVGSFLAKLREHFGGSVAWEPRHRSWFTEEADELLRGFRIARVAADPRVAPAAADPGGWRGFSYFRLHGSPRVYYSEYSDDRLDEIAAQAIRAGQDRRPVWCIFDNTAAGAATVNAFALQKRVRDPQR